MLILPFLSLVVVPASPNYKLKSFEFGGGGGTMDSAHYSAEGVIGEAGQGMSSAHYGVDSGLVYVQQANTPPAATLVNSANWYNKLHITLDTANNPSDTVYAIAISSDNWATTEYVQNDNTIGSTLGPEDYQTYTLWGGASGTDIIGLSPSTTYAVKVKARQGNYTESPWGPDATAATFNATLSFDIDIAPTDTETAPPYDLSLGTLSTGSVTTAADKIWVDFDTNADSGGYVYVYDAYAGLRSTAINYTISSTTTNLTSATEGYGLQGSTASNLSFDAPFNNSSDNVGGIGSTAQTLLSTSSPITSGRASVLLKAKISSQTPASNDYTDTLTLISAASF